MNANKFKYIGVVDSRDVLTSIWDDINLPGQRHFILIKSKVSSLPNLSKEPSILECTNRFNFDTLTKFGNGDAMQYYKDYILPIIKKQIDDHASEDMTFYHHDGVTPFIGNNPKS